MNKVILTGNVGKDPEVKHLEGGKVVASFSFATSKKYKNKSGESVAETQWHNIVFWDKLAELVEKYVTKGMKLGIEGSLRHRSYDDKNGEKRYITEVLAESMEFLGTKEKGEPKPEKEKTDFNELNKPEVPAKAAEKDDDLPF